MSKERGRILPPKEEEPKPYSLAARYPDEQSSEHPYYESQQVIFENQQLALSVYRLQLRRLNEVQLQWHVTVVGEQPPTEFDTKFRRILSTGEEVSLPQEVLDALLKRRAQAAQLGSWVEGHYKLGKRRRLS
jgi:hypothetical protein